MTGERARMHKEQALCNQAFETLTELTVLSW